MAIPEQSLTPHEFLVQLRAGSVAIDVRSPGEFEAGHLSGAVAAVAGGCARSVGAVMRKNCPAETRVP